MTDCKSVKYTDGVEFILDLMDDYLDLVEAVEEAVEWDAKVRGDKVDCFQNKK